MRICPYLRCAGRLSLLLLLCLSLRAAHAGSATWNLNPVNRKWKNPDNWTPATVPNGFRGVASFEVSNTTDIKIFKFTQLGGLTFNPGASAFTFTIDTGALLFLRSTGIVNHSSAVQNFVMLASNGSSNSISFSGTSSAGINTVFNAHTTAGDVGSTISFSQGSRAGMATIVLDGGMRPNDSINATACRFFDSSRADHADITGNGGAVSDGSGAVTEFHTTSSADHAVLICNGGEFNGAKGGLIRFMEDSLAADAILVANGGLNGGEGGLILLESGSSGGNARVQLNDTGTLSICSHDPPGVEIGSLEGNGIVTLGSNELTVGSNGLDTIFSGSIQPSGSCLEEQGSLKKVGPGRLALTNRNSYEGGTVIVEGVLLVNNGGGSGTGTGLVNVDSGTLGGRGKIAGPVTVGTGSGGPGAAIAPGQKADSDIATLSIKSALTFNSDGQYACSFDSSVAIADTIAADGVVLDPSAQIVLTDVGNDTLGAGTVFIVIDNVADTPISGIFGNLADGAIVNVNGNNLQASYEGGDGNDLTLTVVP